MKLVLKSLAWLGAAGVALILGQCAYLRISEPRQLRALCQSAHPGSAVGDLLDAARGTRFKVRTGGAAGKRDTDWFDRQTLALADAVRKRSPGAADYSVVFAKPGIGYYACVVTHAGGRVQDAWFEDHGD